MGRSNELKCKQCKGHHTGTWSKDYCPECAKKRGQTEPDLDD